MKKLFQALALLSAFVLLIALPQAAADGVRSALTLYGRVILPSLFPFFVCSNLFLLLGYSARLSARFGGAAAKLLRLPPAAGSAFLLGLLGGYPPISTVSIPWSTNRMDKKPESRIMSRWLET